MLALFAAFAPIALIIRSQLARDVFGSSVLMFFVAAMTARFFGGTVRLRYRHVGGFWRKNAGAIALALVSAIGGALITILVDRAVKRWGGP